MAERAARNAKLEEAQMLKSLVGKIQSFFRLLWITAAALRVIFGALQSSAGAIHSCAGAF
jgi:hypothetical protein